MAPAKIVMYFEKCRPPTALLLPVHQEFGILPIGSLKQG
jgi:hypothetical protein